MTADSQLSVLLDPMTKEPITAQMAVVLQPKPKKMARLPKLSESTLPDTLFQNEAVQYLGLKPRVGLVGIANVIYVRVKLEVLPPAINLTLVFEFQDDGSVEVIPSYATQLTSNPLQ